MNIIIFILFYATFTFGTSSPISIIRRQDPLSGFKPCNNGINFPNEITLYTYTPNPIVVGQAVTVRMAGKANVPIVKGALIKYNVFYNNKQLLEHSNDFCDEVVTPAGFTCPVEGDFDFTNNFPMDAPNANNGPNTIMELFIRMDISNPDGTDLSCIEGNVQFSS
ncbi:hypothetical protein RclHR1_03820008 [Rhizophagus clarus]|uniref:Phosphatidylglycerol/phosphatidylinositol transfer protein n=1 Tax=Rhizophagus clarus TaxID=94130 RepID=A0A2Z6RGZ8_9GLOM|nr:hypothetical protein RclHR1_03820008 [Rhizophagus clarus]GET01633.1 phosphatidylglycerol/phosphatidylinositol transfer protein [Rhizophagus clarus]